MPEQIIRAPAITFARAPVIVAPSQYLLTGDQFLRLRIWCFAARTWTAAQRHFTLATRTLTTTGEYQVGTQDITADPNANPREVTLGLEPGAIQSAIVTWTGSAMTTAPGLAYAVVDFMQGTPTGASQVIGTLVAGYVAPGLPLAWPGTPILGPLEGPGYFDALILAGAVGNEVTLTVGVGEVWRIRAVFTRYVADATAATRKPRLVLTLDGTAVATFPSAGSITAGQTGDTVWMPGAALAVGSGVPDSVAPIPDALYLRGPDTLSTSTISRQAGDQYTQFIVLADRYLETL